MKTKSKPSRTSLDSGSPAKEAERQVDLAPDLADNGAKTERERDREGIRNPTGCVFNISLIRTLPDHRYVLSLGL